MFRGYGAWGRLGTPTGGRRAGIKTHAVIRTGAAVAAGEMRKSWWLWEKGQQRRVISRAEVPGVAGRRRRRTSTGTGGRAGIGRLSAYSGDQASLAYVSEDTIWRSMCGKAAFIKGVIDAETGGGNLADESGNWSWRWILTVIECGPWYCSNVYATMPHVWL